MSSTRLLATLTGTSPAAASTVLGSESAASLASYSWFTVDATLQGATGGTLNVYLQREIAAGVWVDWVSFPQIAASGASRTYSFDSRAALSLVTTTVGTGTASAATPSLAEGVMAVAHPGTRVRLVYVAGSGTSAGAVQTVRLFGWRSL